MGKTFLFATWCECGTSCVSVKAVSTLYWEGIISGSAQRLLLAVFRGPYGIQRIDTQSHTGLNVCKANDLSAVLLLCSPQNSFLMAWEYTTKSVAPKSSLVWHHCVLVCYLLEIPVPGRCFQHLYVCKFGQGCLEGVCICPIPKPSFLFTCCCPCDFPASGTSVKPVIRYLDGFSLLSLWG